MIDSLRPALIITYREVRDQLRDWRIIFPVVALTIFFPYLMNFTAQQILGFVQRYGASIIGERMVPFLLMIVGFFPISVSLVIALETFVGEKERGSIEPLLNTPLKDWQLYVGKLLAATVPPLVSSFLGMGVYLIGLAQKGIPWPEPAMLIQIICLTIIQAVMMVSGAVVVSSQATSVRAANLLASFIIIPAALLIQGESVVMFWGNYSTLWWAVFGLLVLTVLLVRVGLAHFRREELLGREIDVLSVRWIGRTFWQEFTSDARNLWDWYIRVLPGSIRGLGKPALLVTLIVIVAFWVGSQLIHQFQIPLNETNLGQLDQQLEGMVEFWPLFGIGPVLGIWWQNVRVLIISQVLGIFSFGIFGMVPLFASMSVVGYLGALLQSTGIPLENYAAFILPHGIIEIPAAILSTAAVLQAGAFMATPHTNKTMGEALIASLARWLQVMLGAVVPLLFIAAVIEAWITPRIALLLFR